VVAVAGLSTSFEKGIRSQGRELLAADVRLRGMRPTPPELDSLLAGIPGSARADLREFPTIVASGSGSWLGSSRLARLRVIEGGYPFYGRLEMTPDGKLDELLADDRVIVADALLAQLNIEAGGLMRVGGHVFTVAASLQKEPDRLGIGLDTLAPTVILSAGGLERTGLEGFGSRIWHTTLVKLPDGAGMEDARAAASKIKEGIPGAAHLIVESWPEAQPELRAAILRAERFLGLVALLSLLIGGIGVSQTVRAWLAGRMESIAIVKCLGVRPREVLGLYTGQTGLLGLLGSLAGLLAGQIGLFLGPIVLAGVVPPEFIKIWQPQALARGLALGMGVALLFSLPPLLSVLRVPPARVFRQDAEPIRLHPVIRFGSFAVLLAGIFTTAWVQSRSPAMAALFTSGILGVTGFLALTAWLISRAVSKMPRRFGRIWLRHGLAALGRPGAGTVGAIVALGLGVVVVLGMYLIESRVSAQFEAELPDEAPSAFVINIQPDQWEGVRELLESSRASRIDSVPLVNARLVSIDGVEIDDLLEERSENDEGRRQRRRVLTREQRITWMEELPEDNEIVDGALWSEPDLPEISIEQGFAESMGVSVGSRVVIDVQGLPLELAVTSTRSVVWESFGINFFLIAEPGVLDAAPQSRVAAVRLPPGTEQEVQDRLVSSFPNLTMFPIREFLDRIVEVLQQAGLGVRILGGFTVLAGIFILAGAVSAGAIRRGREVALMKTLGMTRRGVLAVYSVEYALVGTTAGIIGVGGAGILAWTILTQWMEVPTDFGPGAFLAAAVATVILAVAAGTAASLRALTRRPVEVLRNE
jgi:putative ABC transport system permease protein